MNLWSHAVSNADRSIHANKKTGTFDNDDFDMIFDLWFVLL